MNLGSPLKTCPAPELIAAMNPASAYSQDQVLDLLPAYPRACVRDTLHSLIDKGIVWRNNSTKGAIRYSVLDGERLQEAIERKTTRGETPAWMKTDLTGYDANNARFCELCMATRKA
jgi:hypothetical protein